MAVQNPYNDVTGALGIYGDLASGTATGKVRAGAAGARIAANEGWAPPSWGAGAGAALGGLEVAQGIERGGVSGYGEAAIGAGRLGVASGLIPASSGLAQGIPVLGAGLGVYNFAKNWRSGATGSDTLSGLEAGASIGAIGGPVGSLIGAGLGAAVGAVSSIFGPGRQDPETVGWDQYASAYQKGGAAGVAGASPQQNFQMLAGIFDARGSSIPFYQRYGRMGENKFLSDMTTQIDSAVKAGKVPPGADASQIYKSVVEPWITSMGGKAGWQNTSTVKGAPEKQAIGQLLTNLIGQYQTGQINSSTPLGIGGQTVAGIHPYAGTVPTPTAHAASNKSPAGVSSAPGATMAVHPYQTYDPALGAGAALGGLAYQQTPTGQPPMVGASGQGNPPGTAAAPTSVMGDLFGAPTAGDPLSGLGTFGIEAGLGFFGEREANKQDQALINPALAAGNFYTGVGENLTSTAGRLTPLQSTALSTAVGQGTTLIQAATPVGAVAQGLYKQYQSGNLKPGDQAQLDQQVASAKAQLLQKLGPNVDSTTAQTYLDQIDQQATITKQKMLDDYLSTGNSTFDTWAKTTEQGQQTIAKGFEDAVQNIDNNFQTAFQAANIGSSTLLNAIQLALGSNEQLSGALGSYMGNLAKAYALSKGMGAAGKAGQAVQGVASTLGQGGGPSISSTAYEGGSLYDKVGMTSDINAIGPLPTDIGPPSDTVSVGDPISYDTTFDYGGVG